MFKPLNFKTYQDVKHHLFLYSIIILYVLGLWSFYLILPKQHQDKINDIIMHLRLTTLLKHSSITIIFGLIAFFFIYIIEIHDKIYDKYFIKWRRAYDIDIILRRLCQPFQHKLDYNFFNVAEQNRYEFMKIFYHFALDYNSKIPINLLVRFYERITKYWIARLNEIFIFLLFLEVSIYSYFYVINNIPYYPLLISLIIIALIFLLNNLFVRHTLKEVKRATLDEIDAIHERYIEELEKQIKNISEKFNLIYEK